MTIYYFLVILGIFASACSQLLLKKSANKRHKNFITSILNPRVLAAYLTIFISLAINIFAMSNGVQLKDIPILESLGYIFIPLLSLMFLKETISARTWVSILLIILGVVIFYI